MRAVVFQTLACFVETRDVSRRYPPQHVVRLAWPFKPIGAFQVIIQVAGTINELLQIVGTSPYRHIHQHEWILSPRVLNVGGVAGFTLQPPDEAGRLFGESVNMIQAIHKFANLGVVERMEDPPDIQLGELEVHRHILAETKRGAASLRYNLGVN